MAKAHLRILRSVPVMVTFHLIVLHFLRRLQPNGILWPLLELAAGTLILWILYFVELHPRFFSTFRDLPRIEGGLPFVGYGLTQFLHPRGEIFLQWTKAKDEKTTGLIYFPGFWNADQLLLTNSQAFSEVLVRRPYAFTKPPAGASLIRRGIGDSLFIAEGDEHRRLRRILQPFFNFRKMHNLYPIFWMKAIDLANATARSDPGKSSEEEFVAEVLWYADKVTLDTIGLAALGKDFKSLTEPHELAKAAETAAPTKLGMQVIFIATALLLPWWALKLIPGGMQKRLNEASEQGIRVCERFVEERKSDEKIGGDVFRQLIDAQVFTDTELVDNLRMIIATGHDPTAATFIWVLYYLSIHPEWQKRLREELHANIPNHFFTSDDDKNHFTAGATLDTLPVLNACINETLRYMPTTPVTSRVADRETTILSTIVPKGTKILIAPYVLNRLVEHYGPTAEDFDPGRWIENNGKANNHGGASTNYAFSTFLHGPRKCLGMAYAKAEIRSFTAAFVARFDFEMADKKEVPVESGMFSTRPRDGLSLRLRKVGGWW